MCKNILSVNKSTYYPDISCFATLNKRFKKINKTFNTIGNACTVLCVSVTRVFCYRFSNFSISDAFEIEIYAFSDFLLIVNVP
jgi:hypothetical protein